MVTLIVFFLSALMSQASLGATSEMSKVCAAALLESNLLTQLLKTSSEALDQQNSAEDRQAYLEFFMGSLLSYTDKPEAMQVGPEAMELLRNYRRLRIRAEGVQLEEPGILHVTDRWSDALVAIPAVAIEEVARLPNGEIWEMTYAQAKAYCADPARNGRLPTAYELAVLAHSRGAQAPVESAYYGRAHWNAPEVQAEVTRMHRLTVSNDAGYLAIYTKNSATQGDMVDFYANRSGFRPLDGDQANHNFWSDSVSTILLGRLGTIYPNFHPGIRCAVRCVR